MESAFRSLRFRIALAFVLWTALIELAISLVLPPISEALALRAVDEGLATPAASLAAEITASGVMLPDLTAWTHQREFQGWGGELLLVELRDAEGRVVAASEGLRGGRLPVDPEETAGSMGRRFVTTERLPEQGGEEDPLLPRSLAGSRARVLILPVRLGPDQSMYHLLAARSLSRVDEVTGTFYSFLFLITSMTTLGAGVAGWVIASRISMRLEEVASRVRRISPTNLDERLDLSALPDEIGRLASDVNIMLERLATGFRSQERFIYDVSHELKTPVAVLLAEAQSLKMRRNGEDERAAFVLSVEDEMRRLGRLVESFLMLARFGHGRRFLGESIFSINDVALESVQHSKLLAIQHGVTLSLSLYEGGEDCDDDATVRGDADLVRVVIDNLIRNAVQYSMRGDTVRVTVGCRESQTTISVEDHGRGVPEEHLKTIFDRFSQAPVPTTSGRRGTGLGLAIAKGVVDLHRGSIEVRNRPEGGCAFTVALPLLRATSEPIEETWEGVPAGIAPIGEEAKPVADSSRTGPPGGNPATLD